MRCQSCGEREALERGGEPALLNLFGEIEGYFCAECSVRLQEPHETELRRLIAEHAPHLCEEELRRVPGQMLRFTLNLPLPGTPTEALPPDPAAG